MTSLGEPNVTAIVFFAVFIALSLGITVWASRKTRTTDQFYAAGRSVTAFQNGLALAGDYMSAASFLGIAGLVAMSGFDGLIYSIGWLVGWPIVMFLIAEPLRNLGRYTFADVVAARLRQTPIRIAASIGALAVISFYLIAQMVGAGNLIRLLFGLPYEVAVMIVGVVMLAYVLFGGMIATTWVQIVKAVLLLGGATLLAGLVLMRFSFNPLALFAQAATIYGSGVLAPGRLVSDPIDAISLGLALMLGTAGLPHILMRFYTVPDAKTARTSVGYATAFIGFFYLLTFVLGFGAMVILGRETITKIDAGGNMAAPLLAEARWRHAVSRVHCGGCVRDDSGRRRWADTVGRRNAVARPVGERVQGRSRQRARAAPRRSRRDGDAGDCLHPPWHRLQGPECRLHGRPGVRDRGQRKLSGARTVDLLEAADHRWCGGEHDHRDGLDARAHLSLAHDPDRHPSQRKRLVPAQESWHCDHSALIHRRDRRLVTSPGGGRGASLRRARAAVAPRC